MTKGGPGSDEACRPQPGVSYAIKFDSEDEEQDVPHKRRRKRHWKSSRLLQEAASPGPELELQATAGVSRDNAPSHDIDPPVDLAEPGPSDHWVAAEVGRRQLEFQGRPDGTRSREHTTLASGSAPALLWGGSSRVGTRGGDVDGDVDNV